MQHTKQELNVKQQQDSNVVGQLKTIIIEKEAKIKSLEREIRDLQADMVSSISVHGGQSGKFKVQLLLTVVSLWVVD
jgi:SMC interacting uncharacterized protein involved in chromosome segregation